MSLKESQSGLMTESLPNEDSSSSRGELASLVQERDWSGTPLGLIAQWPQSLRTVVNIILTSRYAMWMGWGKDLSFFYNDAYRPTLGLKHPWALGSPAHEVWAEIWRDIGPRIHTVLSTGEATWDQGLLLFLERSGFPEETYHTFSYSPLTDDSGQINGMLCVVTEETERVISERRMATLRDLASELAGAKTEEEVLAAAGRQLAANTKDLPFTLTYLIQPDGQARLVCTTGIPEDHPAAAPLIAADSGTPWPVAEFLRHSGSLFLDNLKGLAMSASLPRGAWDKPVDQAVVVPIKGSANERPAGFLVVGFNPYRRYDSAYAGFIELAAGQLAAGLANARAYDEERRRAAALAELDRAKTTFFSNISHEFRTPLTLMLGPVEDLLAAPDDILTAGNREMLRTVQRSGLRLQRLVNALLDFSRIEAGRAQANYEPTDLGTFTADLASTFRSAMERAGLRYTVSCGLLSRDVLLDREMWEKVVLNLLSNAFKYTLEGSVTVQLQERGEMVEFSVIDTGVGIPEKDLPHLFQRFHRVEGMKGRTHEGTGIGLALVQELVKLHGGTVDVASVVGSGSTFTVTLPFRPAHTLNARLNADRTSPHAVIHAEGWVDEAMRWLPETDSALPSPPDAGEQQPAAVRSRVLLADDNADMLEYIRRLLSARYEVIAVSNGEEALAAALERRPDLVLTDVMMPVLDGFGLLRALRGRESTRTLPILLLSARAGEESRVEGLDAGADDYLVKPFTTRELLARVEAHLSLARMRREADQARKLSELRLGLALETSNMCAWEWNPQSDEVFAIGDLQKIFGVTLRQSVEGFRLVHPDDLSVHRAKVERVALAGGSYVSEFRIYRADTGRISWLEERATGIADESGQVQRVVGIVVDVTSRKEVEEELRRKNHELTKANKELEEFAYVASHDLQEPLRMINIYTQLLLRQKGVSGDPEAGSYAGFVHQGVHRMEELIKDLLLYSRVIHPDQERAHSADLNKSLDLALSDLHMRIEEAQAVIVRGALPVVFGEERQLALVFQNLLSNALKYRRRGTAPTIEIGAQPQGAEWIVSVKDNGIGFEPQHASIIFGLFKRLYKDAYPGTGLGLAISKRIVERYDGQIWASSPGEGQGAVFSFLLKGVSG